MLHLAVNAKNILRYIVWLALGTPLAVMIYRYTQGWVFYGEFLHWTGVYSIRLLMLALAITPLRLFWRRATWSLWLLQQRRAIGIAVFAYAAAHTAAYLYKLAAIDRVIAELAEPGLWTAWAALVVFLLLALTSNNFSLRRLGWRWKALHRCVYPAMVLAFGHWLLVAFNRTAALLHLGALVSLYLGRFIVNRYHRGRSHRV